VGRATISNWRKLVLLTRLVATDTDRFIDDEKLDYEG
jgi:hypothetical protein